MHGNVNIEFAALCETTEIMTFVKNHWSPNHILANDQTFFEFQYIAKDKLHFVIARSNSGCILGILGFINYTPGRDNPELALALWRVIDNEKDPLLGLKLVEFLRENIQPQNIYCVGINKNTIPIYQYLGFETGLMQHLASFNSKCKVFNICTPPANIQKPEQASDILFSLSNCNMESFSKIEKMGLLRDRSPSKSMEFIEHRYCAHPYFVYFVYEVYVHNILVGALVTRERERKKHENYSHSRRVCYKKAFAARIGLFCR